jgi:hypothetical protein
MTHHEPPPWRREVITAATEAALCALRDAKLTDRFYLAGGTGLALQLGHRRSQDLDFFADSLFDEEILLQRVQTLDGFALVGRAPHTLHATVRGTKVSFLGYAYPQLFPRMPFLGVDVADPREIACMKVSAITSRGTKRDFVDLYIVAQQIGLAEILRLFARKYAQVRYSKTHLLKSLTFFEDAEKDAMPDMLVPFQWDDAKRFFLRETPKLL